MNILPLNDLRNSNQKSSPLAAESHVYRPVPMSVEGFTLAVHCGLGTSNPRLPVRPAGFIRFRGDLYAPRLLSPGIYRVRCKGKRSPLMVESEQFAEPHERAKMAQGALVLSSASPALKWMINLIGSFVGAHFRDGIERLE